MRTLLLIISVLSLAFCGLRGTDELMQSKASLSEPIKNGGVLGIDVSAYQGYVDFGFLFGLEVRRAFFVTRQRGPLKYEVKEGREVSGDVISDEVIVLTGDETREKYTKPLRRIFAVVELNGQKHDMVFLTNNLDWATP